MSTTPENHNYGNEQASVSSYLYIDYEIPYGLLAPQPGLGYRRTITKLGQQTIGLSSVSVPEAADNNEYNLTADPVSEHIDWTDYSDERLLLPAPPFLDEVEYHELQDVIADLLATISERECRTLASQFELGDHDLTSIEALSEEFGVSKQTVQSYLNAALNKLNRPDRAGELRDFWLVDADPKEEIPSEPTPEHILKPALSALVDFRPSTAVHDSQDKRPYVQRLQEEVHSATRNWFKVEKAKLAKLFGVIDEPRKHPNLTMEIFSQLNLIGYWQEAVLFMHTMMGEPYEPRTHSRLTLINALSDILHSEIDQYSSTLQNSQGRISGRPAPTHPRQADQRTASLTVVQAQITALQAYQHELTAHLLKGTNSGDWQFVRLS